MYVIVDLSITSIDVYRCDIKNEGDSPLNFLLGENVTPEFCTKSFEFVLNEFEFCLKSNLY
jgi:hypothetical protein